MTQEQRDKQRERVQMSLLISPVRSDRAFESRKTPKPDGPVIRPEFPEAA